MRQGQTAAAGLRDTADAAEREDAGLVAAVRAGDDRAFETLYERYQRRVFAYVLSMVGDHGRAEDVTQEVFISALRRIRATQRPIAFKPWVYEIAKNACIDAYRRTRRGEEVSYDASEQLGAADRGRLASAQAGPDSAIEVKQRLEQLQRAFGGLSESHHEILVLRELEGRSYREIGERMGLSRPSVESTLFRARRRLSEEYDELESGRRCQRVQSMIAGAGGADLTLRERRRLTTHVRVCQACRREARLAGLNAASGRRAGLDRVAAFVPLPLLFVRRVRTGGAGTHASTTVAGHASDLTAAGLAPLIEPVGAISSKAVAIIVSLAVAGAGASVASHDGAAPSRHAAPQARQSSASARAAATRASSATSTRAGVAETQRRSQRGLTGGGAGSARSRSAAPAAGSADATATAPVTPSATGPAGRALAPPAAPLPGAAGSATPAAGGLPAAVLAPAVTGLGPASTTVHSLKNPLTGLVSSLGASAGSLTSSLGRTLDPLLQRLGGG